MNDMVCSNARQQGATLVVALVVLLLLGFLAGSLLKSTALEQKMAGNLADQTIAFHAAEDALINIETWLLGNPAALHVPYVQGMAPANQVRIYKVSQTGNTLKKTLVDKNHLAKWLSLAYPVKDITGSAELSSTAGVTLATIEQVIGTDLYRIIVRNTGASGRAEVILESVVRV